MSLSGRSLTQQLEDLHADCPRGTALVFGDLSTGTVLRVVEDVALGQEVHDAALSRAVECCCDAAEDALAIGAHAGAGGCAPDAAVPMRALRVEGERLLLVRRGGEERLDALTINLSLAETTAVASSDAALAALLQRLDAVSVALLDGHD